MRRTVTLPDGGQIPLVGLGTYLAGRGRETRRAVGWALQAGYRLFDTSLAYGNEPDVGRAVRESSVARDAIFITTKLENDDQGHDSARRACEKSLRNLRTDYVDLYLIHWPVPHLRETSWRTMQQLLGEGKCRAIGVSNYTINHLRLLLADTGIVPAVNQVEFHPFLYQEALLNYCRGQGIVLQAYSPLVKALRMEHPLLVRLGRKYGKTPAQILVRWHIEHGVPSIPKSVRRAHIEENIDVWDFGIEPGDRRALDGLNENRHFDWDPTDVP